MLKHEELIVKYLDKSCTREEEEELLAWLEVSEENKELFSSLSSLWLMSKAELGDDLETELALARFRERIGTEKSSLREVQKVKLPLLYKILQVAAIFLILFNIVYFLYKEDKESEPQIINRLLTADSKGKFILPDSTVVWLNTHSVLEYPEHFAEDKREVHLKGEAYFEVKKDSAAPFWVNADDIKVRVLGTSFLVQNYDKSEYVETILTEGAVNITSSHFKEVAIVPNERVLYLKKGGSLKCEIVNTNYYTSWINEKLVFDNLSLANIIINLNKWYGVDIECSKDIAESTNMSFTVCRESLDEILEAMEEIAPIRYKHEGYKVYITKKGGK